MKDAIDLFFSDHSTIIYEFEDAYNAGKNNEMPFEEWFELNKLLIYEKMRAEYVRGFNACNDFRNMVLSF